MSTSHSVRNLIRLFESNLEGKLDKDELARKETNGEYPYVPYDIDHFEDLLNKVKLIQELVPQRDPKESPRFVDVGCGIGTKLLLARMAGFHVTGIEMTHNYVKVAKKLLSHTGHNNWQYNRYRSTGRSYEIIEGDALIQDYSPYDVIYFYCPLKDYKMQEKLNLQIVRTARKGAIFISCGHTMFDKQEGIIKVGKESYTHDSQIFIKS